MKKVLLLGFVLLLAGCASYQKASAARAGEVIITYDDMTGIKRAEVFIDKTKFKFLEHNFEQFSLLVVEHKESTNYYICFNLHYGNRWFIDTLLIKVGDTDPIYGEI
ncbi:unnamed protein product [marine sediment metagenome]|uniref:Uncharacterized protein n=1 Tax=marine sediment metagenome TaxID=412755 RepID=X1BRT4_9ZZZZ